ncbi:MAG TPA: Stp1/IreP family PP2C-type Ser/Thr phosphatase [Clostridiales bacterium]|nr:Stp1/IreP family PP2C-type Ser/Thr phosphatase [Clostridiales bacterium]
MYGIKSHKGMVREINEDSCNVIFGSSKMKAAFIIADGMGGHNAGEVASRMAVEYISEKINEAEKDFSEDGVCQFLISTIKEANDIIFKKSNAPGPFSGMGTTLIIAVFFAERVYIGHVGDSRVYVIRNNGIQQLTTDHSYVEELIKNGSLSRVEAENHPQKHVITRAIGCFEDVEADIYTYDIHTDDTFVLCTDGLTNMLSDDIIKSIIIQSDDPQSACAELVEKANKSGGNDNITLCIIRV